MDQRSKWIVFGLIGVAVIVVGCLILALLGVAVGWGTWGSSGPHMRGDRMEGICPWCGGAEYQTPWNWVVGGVWLARSTKPTSPHVDESLACPNCGKEVEPGWKVCPNCGERLAD
jgi:RNA polymerase subunit RPABC4/transcription elongation factor Spt4